MPRVSLSVYVDGVLADSLEERAKIAGLSRSAFIERLLAREAAGGDKRGRRNIAYLMTAVGELLRVAGDEPRERARKAYQKRVELEGLHEDEPMEDQRRVARG